MSQESVELEVATPRGLYTDTFSNTAKVQEVIDAAIKAKELESSESFELFLNGEALAPTERTLVSYGLEGVVHLELVATGSGV